MNFIRKFSAKRATTNRRGFTLVEILIAITIATMVMGAVLYALSTGMRANARINSPASPVLDELNFFRALQSDISSIVQQEKSFVGTPTSMTFTRLVSPNNSTNNIVPAHIEWMITPNRGARTGSAGILPASYNVFIKEQFSYRGGDSDDPLSAQWRDTWDSPTPPGQIRLGDTIFTIWTSNFSIKK